eukprot:29312-Pelagococcus_subviridis.AAC.8
MGASPSVVFESFSHVTVGSGGGPVSFFFFVSLFFSSSASAAADADARPCVASIFRSYASYAFPLTCFSASCACTIAFVFSATACSNAARFKHRNGMCRNARLHHERPERPPLERVPAVRLDLVRSQQPLRRRVVAEVQQNRRGDVFRRGGELSLGVLVRPPLGRIHQEHRRVRALVHVDHARIQRVRVPALFRAHHHVTLARSRAVVGHRLQSIRDGALRSLVDDVPDLEHDVVLRRRPRGPLDVRRLDLRRGRVLRDERPAAQAAHERRLPRPDVASQDDFEVEFGPLGVLLSKLRIHGGDPALAHLLLRELHRGRGGVRGLRRRASHEGGHVGEPPEPRHRVRRARAPRVCRVDSVADVLAADLAEKRRDFRRRRVGAKEEGRRGAGDVRTREGCH